MNVEIGAEAALFPEKEYISGIFVAVCSDLQVLVFDGPYQRSTICLYWSCVVIKILIFLGPFDMLISLKMGARNARACRAAKTHFLI
jgi:hypothetical protein